VEEEAVFFTRDLPLHDPHLDTGIGNLPHILDITPWLWSLRLPKPYTESRENSLQWEKRRGGEGTTLLMRGRQGLKDLSIRYVSTQWLS